MRLARSAALILAVSTLAASALAGEGTPLAYSQLRQDFPQINDAIAAAPSSDLHGTFNRLSALYNRAPIDSAAVDAGTNGQLPANFERNLEATLLDLQEDLGKDEIAGLNVEQKLDILQVVRIYAFRRPLELWDSVELTTCEPITPCVLPPEQCGAPPPACVDDDPTVLNEVQDTVDASRPMYTTVFNSIPAADRGTLTTPANLDADNFIGSVETMLTIKGVESIDD